MRFFSVFLLANQARKREKNWDHLTCPHRPHFQMGSKNERNGWSETCGKRFRRMYAISQMQPFVRSVSGIICMKYWTPITQTHKNTKQLKRVRDTESIHKRIIRRCGFLFRLILKPFIFDHEHTKQLYGTHGPVEKEPFPLDTCALPEYKQNMRRKPTATWNGVCVCVRFVTIHPYYARAARAESVMHNFLTTACNIV